MCILCYGLAGEDHWTQAHGEEGARARRRRRDLAALVLTEHGLTLKGDVGGLADVVGDRKGRSAVVRGLGELWPAAQQLSPRPLDPLDPDLLDRLSSGRGDAR